MRRKLTAKIPPFLPDDERKPGWFAIHSLLSRDASIINVASTLFDISLDEILVEKT